MIYISFVDKNSHFAVQAIRTCRKHLKRKKVSYSVYSSYQEFWKSFKDGKRLHILFSDISLQEENEISEAKKVKEQCPWVQLIFYSSELKHSLMAYEVSHVYFFLKNQMKDCIGPALDQSIEHLDECFYDV